LALDHINTAGVRLADVRKLGTEGRFVSETGATLWFHGANTDCDGQCDKRPLLHQSDFEHRLATLNAIVEIERTAGTNLVRLRNQLIDRLLMGATPLAGVDADLERARIGQPPEFLVLDWN